MEVPAAEEVDSPSIPRSPAQPPTGTVRETRYERFCSATDAAEVLCNRIPYRCDDPELTPAFAYTRTRNTHTGATTPWALVQDPPFVCLGADTEAVPIEVLIADQLARDFASLPLPKGDVSVRPDGGRTLVNVETRFFTRTATQALPQFTLLGRGVTVTAMAQRYDWHWDDGTSTTDAGPGSEAQPVVHVYEGSSRVHPYVSITWGGTFTVAGNPRTFDIDGTATTDGRPADLDVLASRSELIAH